MIHTNARNLTFALFIFIAMTGLHTFAKADARVVPSAKIPLDVSKTSPSAPGKIVNHCLFESTLKSVLPQAWRALSSSNTLISLTSEETESEDSRGGATLPIVLLLPKFHGKMTYSEWTTPTTEVKHFVDLDMGVDGYFNTDRMDVSAALHTDAIGQDLKLNLGMYSYLPRLEIRRETVATCSEDNWGRPTCVPGNVLEASLIVPKEFVAKMPWQNYDTSRTTKKEFDFGDYADCLLYNWENP